MPGPSGVSGHTRHQLGVAVLDMASCRAWWMSCRRHYSPRYFLILRAAATHEVRLREFLMDWHWATAIARL